MAIARACISIATDALEVRPANLAHVHVAAAITWPNAEGSRVTFFFDPEYFRRFETRDNEYQRWTPLNPERSLMRDLGIERRNLRERGYHTWDYEPEDPPRTFEGEIWMIGD